MSKDGYSKMSADELQAWAENELFISGDDPKYGGEILVARGILSLIEHYKQLLSTRPL